LIDVPDLGSFLGRIAGSVEKIAGVKPPTDVGEMQSAEIVSGERRNPPHERVGRAEDPPAPSRQVRAKEASHA
jgi:hypothetical protein